MPRASVLAELMPFPIEKRRRRQVGPIVLRLRKTKPTFVKRYDWFLCEDASELNEVKKNME